MIKDTEAKIIHLRTNITQEHAEWFKEAHDMADKVGAEITMPRVTGRQQHRSNSELVDAITNYRANYSIKFIDHLLTEYRARFSDENQVGVRLLLLLPAYIHNHPGANLEEEIGSLAFWESDLCHPSSLKNELKDWWLKWSVASTESLPSNLLHTLAQCDSDVYPCIHRLLTIGCTLPVTSCEAERSFSSLRQTMSYLRSSMGEERLASLTLLHVHPSIHICPNEVVRRFVEKHSRRMFRSPILYD